MKQALWLANSSLVLILVLSVAVYELLRTTPPFWKAPKVLTAIEEQQVPLPPTITPLWDQIYQDDIFGTYIHQEIKPVKQSFITPIPELKQSPVAQPPDVKKQEFVAPLTITLRGIIASTNESNNVAMIADEANKEGMYYLGEKIKDAQIIKIAQNRVVLLRANGQQEVFHLRKKEINPEQTPEEKWKYIVRKTADSSYEIDPFELSKEIESLGQFIERSSIIGSAYQNGSPIGLRVGKIDPTDLSGMIGFVENDIITRVNELDVAPKKNRVALYNAIVSMPLASTVNVLVNRSGQNIPLSYKLVKIERPRKRKMFTGVQVVDQQGQTQQAQPQDAFKMNRLQQREQTRREFNQMHPDTPKNQQTMMEIRRRILENLHNRVQQNPGGLT